MLNFGGCILLPLRCAGVRKSCWRKMSKSSTKESHLRQSWRYLWLFNGFHRVMALWDKTCLEFPSEFSQTFRHQTMISVTVSWSILNLHMYASVYNLTFLLYHQPFPKVLLVFFHILPPNQHLLKTKQLKNHPAGSTKDTSTCVTSSSQRPGAAVFWVTERRVSWKNATP